MINVIEATKIVRKYSPTTKLKLTDGCDGLYLPESDVIWLGRDWNISGLLHEITHAMLYKEDGRTGHDGVFADRLTKLCGEVFEGDYRYPVCVKNAHSEIEVQDD